MSLLQYEPEQPVKRKRGRPAKQNKDEGIYPSFTMQFRAFPESTSPCAELNSNMIMQMGQPDAFTPLMKVSPSIPRKKARKNSSASTSTAESPAWEHMASMARKPRLDLGLSSDTATKLSLITSDEMSPPPYLSTPPNSALKPSLRMSPHLIESRPKQRAQLKQSHILKSQPLSNKADVCLQKETAHRGSQNISFIEDNSFSFELTVDDGGRAALAAKNTDSESVSVSASSDSCRDRSSVVSTADSCMSLASGSGLGTSASSVSDLALEQAPGEKFIVPQTPNPKDCATPRMDSILENHNMAFNLTPQFNSMMYSMMNINSPQMRMPLSPSAKYPQSPSQFACVDHHKPDALESSISTAQLAAAASPEPRFNADEGDARAALKRAFRRY